MIKGLVYFDRFRTQEEPAQLVELAKAENHGVFAPTHVLRKDGNMVGYFSVGPPGVPFVFMWLSRKEISPRESFHLINAIESQAAHNGAWGIASPVSPSSPFQEVREALGYRNVGNYDIWLKEL